MTSLRARRVSLLGALAPVLFSITAAADERHAFLLSMGELRVANVHASFAPEQAKPSTPNVIATTTEVTPAVSVVLDGFLRGRALSTNVRLSTDAVVKKADRALLSTVKLPAMGSGGPAEIELGFLAGAITTQPVLSLKQTSAKAPVGSRIESFRVDVTGMAPIAASKIDSLSLAQTSSVVPTADVALEVGAGGAPPFTAWSKKPSARALGIEYVGGDGAALVKIRLEGCTPSSVTPLGASGTTRVALRCATARPG